MSTAPACNENSHPVDVECPSCSHRFQVPLKAFSAGTALICPNCNSNILIATPALRQLLQAIDNESACPRRSADRFATGQVPPGGQTRLR
jgi:DNA-directed RNA polymerase subunit RPC12/RpoP